MSTSYQPAPSGLSRNRMESLVDYYHDTDFPGRQPATLRVSRFWVERFIQWMLATHNEDLSYDCVQAYVTRAYDKYSPKTALECWGNTRRFLRWLYRAGHLHTQPHEQVRTPLVRSDVRSVKAITKEQYIKLREAAAGHWMDWLIMLGWNTGMAISDCMSLRWGEVDMENCVIIRRRLKTGTTSTIPFDPTDELGRGLKALRDADPGVHPEDYVHPECGRHFREDGAFKSGAGSDAFADIVRKAGLPPGTRFHYLRHAFATMLANSNMPMATAMLATGHRDPKVFAAYVRPDLNALRRGVAEAKERSGIVKEVAVAEHGQRLRCIPSKTWRPNEVYMVRRGKLKLPDGTDVRYVKSSPSAEGLVASCQPCDESGEVKSVLHLVVDIRDVKRFV